MKLPAVRQLPSGSWFCQLRLDGQSISITEPTRERCEAKAMAYKTGILTARKQPLSITLAKACDAYIDARRAIRSPTTIRGYEIIRNFAFQGLMNKRLSDITPRAVSLAVQQEAQRTGRNGKRLTAKTIQNEFVFLSSVLRENGVELGAVPLPEVKRKIVRIPEPPAVIRAVIGTPLELPCLLAAWLSLSLSEIMGLTKSKSLLNGQLYVAETVVRVKDPSAPVRTKKDGTPRHDKGTFVYVRKEGGKEEQRSRVLDLPPYLARLIDQVEGDVIVPLTAPQISGGFTRLLKEKGLPHMTFHQLRHLNASAMAMLGIQKEIAQERGGWKTPHTMNQVYTHTFDAPRRAADAKINAYFESLIPPQKPAQKPANANELLTESKKRRVYRLHKE